MRTCKYLGNQSRFENSSSPKSNSCSKIMLYLSRCSSTNYRSQIYWQEPPIIAMSIFRRIITINKHYAIIKTKRKFLKGVEVWPKIISFKDSSSVVMNLQVTQKRSHTNCKLISGFVYERQVSRVVQFRGTSNSGLAAISQSQTNL